MMRFVAMTTFSIFLQLAIAQATQSESEALEDTVVRGQSVQDRRTYPAGTLKDRQKESINGVACTRSDGAVVRPETRSGDKVYKKCVDEANRIKQ